MRENELAKTKFIEYKLFDLTTTNLVFILAYCEQLRRFKRDQGVHEDSSSILNDFNPHRPYMWSYWRVINKLRQSADMFGVRYDFFWEVAVDLAKEIGLSHISPQIFLNENLLTQIIEKSLTYKTEIYSKNKIFQYENYASLEIQKEYYKNLLRKLHLQHETWEQTLRRLLHEQVLPTKFVDDLNL